MLGMSNFHSFSTPSITGQIVETQLSVLNSLFWHGTSALVSLAANSLKTGLCMSALAEI